MLNPSSQPSELQLCAQMEGVGQRVNLQKAENCVCFTHCCILGGLVLFTHQLFSTRYGPGPISVKKNRLRFMPSVAGTLRVRAGEKDTNKIQ